MNGSMDKIINYSPKRGPVQPIPQKIIFFIQISGNIEMKFNSSIGFLIRNFRVPQNKRREPSRKTKLIFKRHAHHNITVVLSFYSPPRFLGPSHPAHPRKKIFNKTTRAADRQIVTVCRRIFVLFFFFRQGNKSENINTRWPREIFEKCNFNKSFPILVAVFDNIIF
jgi:hypothetical protein